MEKFDIKSTRLLVVVVSCCLIFVMSLPFAYRNLPVKKVDRNYSITDQQIASEIRRNNINSLKANSSEIKESATGKSLTGKEEPMLTEINNEDQNNIVLDSQFSNSDIFSKAEKLRSKSKYESAIYEYEQLARITSDDNIKAKCYEEMALTYASMERYGIAISYAKKAFDLAPNTTREIILARLYYKTGEVTKAENMVNRILNRDF